MRYKKIFILLVMCMFFVSPVFGGCTYSTKLDAPKLTMYADDNCISFQSVAGTSEYDIYCNDKLLETYTNETNSSTVLYNFTSILDEYGKYTFYVVAISDSLYLKDSDPSNKVEKVYSKKEVVDSGAVEEDVVGIDFSLSGSLLSCETIEGGDDYVVHLYSMSSGTKTYPLNSTTASFANNIYSLDISGSAYTPLNEIYAIRVGFSDENGEHISTGIKFYNPDNCTGYTDNIYIFDGLIADHYISSSTELTNIMYYSYINRIENFNIKISDTMKTFVENNFDGTSMVDKMNNAVDYAISCYFETQAYRANNVNGGYVKQLTSATEYNIKVTYYGVTECDVTIAPTSSGIYPQGRNGGYYESVDYTMLGSSYDAFVSDDYFLSTPCTTSEQLYWAVENKVTPVIVENSRADTIYTTAKNVLREIISNEMSDYEKALSIFDWIAINTNYDYSNYANVYRGGLSVDNIPMYLPCFYLEGVFMTGNAVCDGFSKAYSLMCNMIGIDAIRIVGTANTGSGNSGGHAWNKVYIDRDGEGGDPGQYYMVDITWTEIVSGGTEDLSHMYFLLSDSDVADTHTNFGGRAEKFNKYVAPDNYYYYVNDTFVYENESGEEIEYNKVITNDAELRDLFYYALDNSLKSTEVVIDLEYMIDYYESINGDNSYLQSGDIEYDYDDYGNIKTKYNPSTDILETYIYDNYGNVYIYKDYYYKLRITFIEFMRGIKFKEQYFSITNYEGDFVYDENGTKGIVYIFSQNLLLDESGEETHLLEYLDSNNIVGEYKLYVSISLLMDENGSSPLLKLQNYLSSAMQDKEMTIELTYEGQDSTEWVFSLEIATNW